MLKTHIKIKDKGKKKIKAYLPKRLLRKLYVDKKYSVAQIAKRLGCSAHKIDYWLLKHVITKRTISDAVYVRHNPNGDPFVFRRPRTQDEAKLFGMGIGLYWGEGTKADKGSVRLGNSDPALIRTFIEFLVTFFHIDIRDLKFHLHVFSDINLNNAIKYWMREISFSRKQLYKPMVTETGKLGTYRKKSAYGVLTVYYANTKLRTILSQLLKDVYAPE